MVSFTNEGEFAMPHGVTKRDELNTGDAAACALPSLAAGQVGIIDRINTLQRAAKRLADMGFVRGVTLEMIRPGTPCIVRVGSVCVGLGAAHQTAIQLMANGA